MKYKSLLKKSTYLAFGFLALLPLIKENINSIFIAIASFLVILNRVKMPSLKNPPLKIWLITSIFWLILIRELISLHPEINLILRYLPFLIFPLLFYYKPNYIDGAFLKKTIYIFQIAIFIKVVLYLILFFKDNSLNTFFYVSNENIPFFRDYVFTHSKIVIHPTYFSAFLLFSFTISLVEISKKISKINKFIHILNILFTLFFIFLLSAKIIILLIPVTILIFLVSTNKKTRIIGVTLFAILCLLVVFSPLKKGLKERFNEVKTEINKPIKGNYYNSTNVRVAILKCSLELVKQMPYLGYGNRIQNELNRCYEKNNDSDFYKINTYNSHNFYLFMLIYGGWLYFFLFLFYMFFLLFKNKKNHLAYLLIIQVLIINLTENFLFRHYGIVLFVYFVSLLTISNDDSKKKINYVSRSDQI